MSKAIKPTLPPLHGGYRPSAKAPKVSSGPRKFPTPPKGEGGGSKKDQGE